VCGAHKYASTVVFPRELLQDLLRHMEWADARVWAAVPAATPQDARLHELLTHIHMVQHAFLTIWRAGDVNAVFQHGTALSASKDVQAWAREYYAEAHAFFGAADDVGLNQLVHLPWAAQIAEFLGRPPGPTTLAETMFQVTSHSTYHRGQVNARLRELGVTPPLVDYIAWLWTGKPAAEWTS
jgi:uncharacterized damage-inducible protein DinB